MSTGERKYLLILTMVFSLFLIHSVHYGLATGNSLENALLKGNWEDVFKILEKDDKRADDPVTRLLMGHACLATNKNNEATRLFLSVSTKEEFEQWFTYTSSLVTKHPNSSIARYLMGDALARLNRIDDALTEFTKSLNLDSKFILAALAKGVLLSLQGEKDKAQLPLLLVTQANPSSGGIWADIGFCWLLLKVPSKALECFEKALELDNQFALAYIGKSCALYGEGRFEEAMQAIEAATLISPDLYELANYNQGMLIVGVNRFLYKVAEYIPDWKRPGTTLEIKGFQYNEVDIGGNNVHSYILRPSDDYKVTESQIKAIASDLSKRVNKPIDKLNLLVLGHGWRASAYDMEAHGARLGAASGKDGIIVLDFPEYRGVQTILWKKVSDQVGLKVGLVGNVLNKTGIIADYSGHSGGAEGFLKQASQLEKYKMPIPEWNNVSLLAPPFSERPFKNRDVTVPPKLLDNCQHITNFYSDFGKWSNKVDGPQDKVTNIKVSKIGHGEWNDATIRENPNPIYPLAGTFHQNRPIEDVKKLADIVNSNSPFGGPKLVIEPFFGASGKTKMFGELPKLTSYYDPKELVIEAPKTGGAVYDRIVRPFDYLGLNDLIHQSVTIAGALKGIEGHEAESRMFDPLASPYAGAIRLGVLEDGRYCLLKFSPKMNNKGQPLSSDPLNIVNWRRLTKDEAMDRLNSSLSYQYQVHKSVDSTFKDLFLKISDIEWQPIFSFPNPPHDPKISEIKDIAKKDPNQEVLLNFGKLKIHTTYNDFLGGNIPMPSNRLEQALSTEYAVTQRFRDITGQKISFRHWMDGRLHEDKEVPLPSVSPFKEIGAPSFGKERLANVWHWDASNLSSQEIVQTTTEFAKRANVDRIAILDYGDVTTSREIENIFKSQGFQVEHFPRTQKSLTDPTVIGMGLAMAKPDHRSIVLSIGSKEESKLQTKPITLIGGKDPLSKIPSLGQSMAKSGMAGQQTFVLDREDLSSKVLSLHLKDYDLKTTPLLPAPEVITDILPQGRVIGVQPLSKEFQKHQIFPSDEISKRYYEVKKDLPLFPPDKGGGAAGIGIPVQYFEPPKPVKLPGGVSMEEFAKTWVDNADWPLSIQCTLGYGGMVSLMR